MFLAVLICEKCDTDYNGLSLQRRKELIVVSTKFIEIAYTVKHFLKQGIARSTMYKILKALSKETQQKGRLEVGA